MFDNAPFDFDAYAARIGYAGGTRPTLETLAGIVRRHTESIAFENLDPFLRRPVLLDAASLQHKLVRDGRGGYCFEQNLLLAHALSALGFTLTGLAARVLWNNPSGVVTPRSHMLLLVHLEGWPWIADVGFGGLTLTGVLRLETDAEQPTPHESFRLRTFEPPSASHAGAPTMGQAHLELVMEARIRDEWRPLYRFGLQPQVLSDYEVTNWYLSNHPRSHFVTGVVAARAASDRRYALRNNELTLHYRDGPSEHRTLASARELRDTLEGPFGIRVPAGALVDEAFARLISAVGQAAPAGRRMESAGAGSG